MTGTTSQPRRDFHVEGHGPSLTSQPGSGFSIQPGTFFLANPLLNNPTVSFYVNSFLTTPLLDIPTVSFA